MQETQSTAQTDIDNMQAQLQQEWDEWFQTLQTALEGDVAGNLLNMINENTDNIQTLQSKLFSHEGDNTAHGVSEKVNRSGDTFTGIVKAHSNTSYAVAQIRNIILSPDDPDVNLMENGDIWIKCGDA